MAIYIESLESRTLLSATPAPVTALLGEAKLIAADTKAVGAAESAGLKVIMADLRAAKLNTSNAAGLRTLNAANAADLKALSTAVRAVNGVVSADTKKLFATQTALARAPSSAKLAAQAAALSTKLSADAAAALSLVTAANNKLITDDNNNVSSLNGVVTAGNLIVDGGFESPDVGTGVNGETNSGAPASGIFEFYTSGTQPGVPTQGSVIGGAWQVASGSVEVLGADPNVTSPQSSTGYFQWVPDEGVQSLDLDGVSPGAIYQDIATVPGQQYTLSFALAGNPAQIPIKTVQVTAASSSQQFTFDITGKTPGNMGWVPETMTFTATAATTRVTFASLDASSAAAGPAVDAIRVVATPTTDQSTLASAVTSYENNLAAAVQTLNAEATTALTTRVSAVLSLYQG